jgi:hypothetical protein
MFAMLKGAMTQRLKITKYRSAQEIVSAFASHLVGIAHIDEVTDDGIYFVADDPNWPVDQRDYDSLCSVVKETLAYLWIMTIEITPSPPGK